MIFLREYFGARLKTARPHPVAQEPAMAATSPSVVRLPLNDECRHALQTRPPQRVLEILNDINLMKLRLTSMARIDEEDEQVREQGAAMEIGPA